jgi:Fur family ferric uptake transcriptional regulator
MNLEQRETAKAALLDFLATQGLRRTKQRESIIQAAMSTTEHFTAEELLAMARAKDPSVSRATVYRTLPLIVKSGLLHELELGGDTKVYDPNFIEHPTHNHLICTDCQKIVEFEDMHMELLENCISRRLGFSPTSKMVKIEATCDEFQKSGVCSRRARA